MRIRGQKYWDWADPELHNRSHDDRLSDGTLIDVQVRLSKSGETQLFVGAYGEQGAMLFEESFDSRPGETMTQALEWGVIHAMERVVSLAKEPAEKPEHLPRAGSRQSN